MVAAEQGVEAGVGEGGLDRVLAVVEVAVHAVYGHVRSVLGGHVAALHLRHAFRREPQPPWTRPGLPPDGRSWRRRPRRAAPPAGLRARRARSAGTPRRPARGR